MKEICGLEKEIRALHCSNQKKKSIKIANCNILYVYILAAFLVLLTELQTVSFATISQRIIT